MTESIAAAVTLVQHLAGLVIDAASLLRRAHTLTADEVHAEVAAIRASAAGVSAADWAELQAGVGERH